MSNYDEKKVLILTGSTDIYRDKNSTDLCAQEVLELTIKSKYEYTKKHNYDFMVLKNFGVDPLNIIKPDQIGYMRFFRSLEMLKIYDVVMWVDGDSIITNPEISINDFMLDDQHTLYASWDWMHNTVYKNQNGYVHAFSTGNFILKRTQFLDQLVDTFYQNVKSFPEEQWLLNYAREYSSLKDTIKILNHNFLNGVPLEIENYEVWKKSNNKLYDPWKPEYFLAHFTGVSNKYRVDLMKEKFGQYL
jgi:hypothetical protein